ncbi:MAG: hypothetical protein ABSG63_15815 [Spirochaetia bacterium]
MKKKILLTAVLVLLLSSALGAFAADNSYAWMTSYNKPNHINVYGGVGYYFGGFSVTGGAEYIISDFNIGPVPLEWGIMAQAILGFSNYSYTTGLDWGAAPMASLHWGTNFGGGAKFDFFISAGLGLYGGAYWAFYNTGAVGLGFASYDGAMWMFSNNLGLLLEYGYIGWTSTAAIGVVWKL